ncbi:MAG TPA: hypothetical protein VMH79_11015 [Thermoanaerobaculia bacterium]|nr:hypothetical protein [Thermoanaerobaculia bacterium]
MPQKWIPGALIFALFVLAHWLSYRVKQRREQSRLRRLRGGGKGDASARLASKDPIEPV